MATVRWIGNAQGVKQVTTIAVTGTWATNDTATLTINGKNVTVTVGTDVSTSNIADILARAVNGSDDTPNLLNDESRNVNGQEVPEFTEVVASNSAATLTLTSATAGVPFTVTASENTAGTGALGSPTEATAATGPNFVDNAANYDTGTVPVTSDTLIFDSGSVDVKYALGHFRTNSIALTVYKTTDYTGKIGLPAINANGYVEYRDRFLKLYTGGNAVEFQKGQGSASLVGATYLDCLSQSIGFLSVDPDALPNGSTASLILYGGTFTTLNIQAGNVELGDSGYANGPTVNTRMIVGKTNGLTTDLTLKAWDLDLTDCEQLIQSSGIVYWRDNLAYTGGGTPTWDHYGGTAYFYGSARVVNVHSGTLYPSGDSASMSDAYLFGGELNGNEAQIPVSGTIDIYMSDGSALRDSRDAFAGADVYLVGCNLADVTIVLPQNKKLTIGTGATIS